MPDVVVAHASVSEAVRPPLIELAGVEDFSRRVPKRERAALALALHHLELVGLVNTITMSVLERTREIGMLRSIGARARDVRAIFATEGLVVALTGWLLGVPLGYVLARAITWLVGNAVGLDIAFVFPLGYVAIALAGTALLALVVMLAPLRRAVRFKPGDAIRYA